ncbi:MAG: pseudouridine synthase [Crocinitomicaceae bacterium]|nr:pseudouridine synthase [Crocinitomicaceae bacterium]
MSIEVVYEDADLLIVSKPNNLLVHHSYFSRNIDEESLVQLVRSQFGRELYPIHRLDRKTSGLLMFAKNNELVRVYQELLENNKIVKKYVALVRGFTDDSGIIDSPIRAEDDTEYKDALSHYRTIERVEVDFPVDKFGKARYSLIELEPKTGRTHQLRKHMNKIAHPIIGDPKYGDRHHNHEFERRFGHTFLFLHARSLEFKSISTNELVSVKASFPVFWEVNLKELGFKVNPNL